MTYYNKNEINYKYCNMMRVMEKSDIAWTFHVQLNNFVRFNEKECQLEMKRWRKLAKENKLVIEKYNNKSATAFDVEWHFLVIQPKDLNEDWGIDTGGFFILGELVSGHIYAFKSKDNRNKVEQYVMKGLENKA